LHRIHTENRAANPPPPADPPDEPGPNELILQDAQNAVMQNAAERLEEQQRHQQENNLEPEQIQQQNVPEPPVPNLVLAAAAGGGDGNIQQAPLLDNDEEDDDNDVFENFTRQVAASRDPNAPSSSSLAHKNIERLADNIGLPQEILENQAQFSSGVLQVTEAELAAVVKQDHPYSSPLSILYLSLFIFSQPFVFDISLLGFNFDCFCWVFLSSLNFLMVAFILYIHILNINFPDSIKTLATLLV
jgi:hypothetical protein